MGLAGEYLRYEQHPWKANQKLCVVVFNERPTYSPEAAIATRTATVQPSRRNEEAPSRS